MAMMPPRAAVLAMLPRAVIAMAPRAVFALATD
jgi:hypothetical protein